MSIEELVPEPRIEQVERGVLHAAVVPVHGRPVVQPLRGSPGPGRCAGRCSAGSTRTIRPTAAWCRSRASRGPPHFGQVVLTQSVISGQRRFARSRWSGIARPPAAVSGSSLSGSGDPAALRAIHDRDRLAPVPLAREDPVAQLELHGGDAVALALDDLGHFHDGLVGPQAVERAGVDERALLDVRKRRLGDVAAGDDLDDGQAVFARETPVALVVAGHGHDRAGAVGDQDVVGDPDGHFVTGGRVEDADAFHFDAGDFLGDLGALEVGLARRGLDVGADFRGVGAARQQLRRRADAPARGPCTSRRRACPAAS